MKLSNQVTNAFFGIIAVIGMFMPLFGYTTLLTANEFNLADIFSFIKNADPNADATLLSNLGKYGFQEEGLAVLICFSLVLVCLLALLVFSFINVPYLARLIASGIGLGTYITAVVFFSKISHAFVIGTIPTTAITSLASGGGEGNVLSTLIGSFVSIQKMGVTTGVFVGIACFAILFAVNLVFFIFRKKFAAEDGEKSGKQKKKKHSNHKSKS